MSKIYIVVEDDEHIEKIFSNKEDADNYISNANNEMYLNVEEYKIENINQLSDGYHTFDELYFHRMILFSIICKQNKDISWRSKLHNDGTMFENYFIVGVNTILGQYTYHYHMEYWDHFNGIKEIPNAPIWDGHKPSDITRLQSIVKLESNE